jgi:hypothetical protein
MKVLFRFLKPLMSFIGVIAMIWTANACPFCDYGGQDAALFIVSFFGLLALGGIFLFALFWRNKGFDTSTHKPELDILKIEGVLPKGNKHV